MQRIPGTDLYLPTGDTHFTREKRGKPFWKDYQHDRIAAAMKFVRGRKVAVDVGAHVGLITLKLAELFDHVYAFEPADESFACLQENTKHLKNVSLFKLALGADRGQCDVEAVTDNSGDRQIAKVGSGPVHMSSLDYLLLQSCDLLKLDVQGYELEVLKGASHTLAEHRPVVIIEDEPAGALRRTFAEPGAAVRRLEKIGATVVGRISDDKIMAWTG